MVMHGCPGDSLSKSEVQTSELRTLNLNLFKVEEQELIHRALSGQQKYRLVEAREPEVGGAGFQLTLEWMCIMSKKHEDYYYYY